MKEHVSRGDWVGYESVARQKWIPRGWYLIWACFEVSESTERKIIKIETSNHLLKSCTQLKCNSLYKYKTVPRVLINPAEWRLLWSANGETRSPD